METVETARYALFTAYGSTAVASVGVADPADTVEVVGAVEARHSTPLQEREYQETQAS